ncbi:MAG: DNA-directed RNA polymerase subunit alpha [Patescibacteria group bacterium]
MVADLQICFVPEKEKDNFGRYLIGPLPNGFGHTVGNSLRRILLGSLSGAAVTQMKVKGATHLFSGLKGVKEDLVDIMLNVKGLEFSYKKDKPIVLKIEKKGLGSVTGADIKLQPGVELANPEMVIATIADKQTVLKVELTVASGIGYSPAENHKSDRVGVIALDASFSPIRVVNYQVGQARRGDKSDLDNLFLEVTTDGSIKPKVAIKQAIEILVEVLQTVAKAKPEKKAVKKEKESNRDLNLLLEELDEVPVRLVNALKKAGYKTVKDLEEAGKKKIASAKNVGDKSVELLAEALVERGIKI